MLIPRDRVRWNDPDGDACSGEGVILSIEDDRAFIQKDDGGEVEAFLHELTPLVRADGQPFMPIYLRVWKTDHDTTTHAGRSPAEADADLWHAIEDGFEAMVGRKPGKSIQRNILAYFRAADRTGQREYCTESTLFI